MSTSIRFLLCLFPGSLALLVGCSSEGGGSSAAILSSSCVDRIADRAVGDWLCPDSLVVGCVNGGADVETIFGVAERIGVDTCNEITVTLDDEGPFYLGTHEIVVRAQADGEEIGACSADLTVVDEEQPTAEAQEIELWPPNHKMHTVSIEDCVVVDDTCDPDLDVYFVSASSDEPVNDVGDGNSEPDILLSCGEAELRSERQGPGDGRVYTLDWMASDDGGNTIAGSCKVTVPHDQSGRTATPSGIAYTVYTSGCGLDGVDEESSTN